jgi:hypothetical protein
MSTFLAAAAMKGQADARRSKEVWKAKVAELRAIREIETQTIASLEARVGELEAEVNDLNYAIDRRNTHLVADKARTKYLMSLLDEAHGGAENNPAREAAYEDVDAFRIPSGAREGEVVPKSDHIYLKAFKSKYEKSFKKTWGEFLNGWIEFLHPRIRY